MYLGCWMQLAKTLALDTNWMVKTIPYLAHCPLVVLNDYFFYKVGKRVIGVDATRLGVIILFFNRFQTHLIIRCFTNGIEQILTTVAFYFYLDQTNKFNRGTVVLTALITVSFMMRNTSPVGWIPLLAIKVLREGSLVPFLISGLTVALPLIALCVYIDTKFYNSEEWVFTGYNFLEMNVLHGLSKYFGEDPFHYYCGEGIAAIFTLLLPLYYLSHLTHIKM